MKTSHLLMLGLGAGALYIFMARNAGGISSGGGSAVSLPYIDTPAGVAAVPQAIKQTSSAASLVVQNAIDKGYISGSRTLPSDWNSKTATTGSNIAAVLSPPGSKNLFSDSVLKQITKEVNR